MRRLETERFIICYPAHRRAAIDRFVIRAERCARVLRDAALAKSGMHPPRPRPAAHALRKFRSPPGSSRRSIGAVLPAGRTACSTRARTIVSSLFSVTFSVTCSRYTPRHRVNLARSSARSGRPGPAISGRRVDGIEDDPEQSVLRSCSVPVSFMNESSGQRDRACDFHAAGALAVI
jgi:hypothetical protein